MERDKTDSSGSGVSQGMEPSNGKSGSQGGRQVQAATPGLIVLDIGILMGSQSQQVFMEHLDLYPGARHLYDVISSYPCECGKESCGRDSFQYSINEASHGNKEAAARIGLRNNWWIKTMFRFAAKRGVPVVCAWGVKHEKRGRQVRRVAAGLGLHLQCLEVALNGEPKHPRFLSESLNLRPLRG